MAFMKSLGLLGKEKTLWRISPVTPQKTLREYVDSYNVLRLLANFSKSVFSHLCKQRIHPTKKRFGLEYIPECFVCLFSVFLSRIVIEHSYI